VEEYPQALRGKGKKSDRSGGRFFTKLERVDLPESLGDKLNEVIKNIKDDSYERGMPGEYHEKLCKDFFSRRLNGTWRVIFYAPNKEGVVICGVTPHDYNAVKRWIDEHLSEVREISRIKRNTAVQEVLKIGVTLEEWRKHLRSVGCKGKV
jgi:Txe/YoeB family toxin of Txe-Axe toxin-antitoxin module